MLNYLNEQNELELRLKVLREDSDLLQRNLAEFLGCTQQTYSRYETGELEPSLVVMKKLAIFYDTSVDYIMGLTNDRERKAIWNSENLNTAKDLLHKREKILSEPKIKRGRKPRRVGNKNKK